MREEALRIAAEVARQAASAQREDGDARCRSGPTTFAPGGSGYEP